MPGTTAADISHLAAVFSDVGGRGFAVGVVGVPDAAVGCPVAVLPVVDWAVVVAAHWPLASPVG